MQEKVLRRAIVITHHTWESTNISEAKSLLGILWKGLWADCYTNTWYPRLQMAPCLIQPWELKHGPQSCQAANAAIPSLHHEELRWSCQRWVKSEVYLHIDVRHGALLEPCCLHSTCAQLLVSRLVWVALEAVQGNNLCQLLLNVLRRRSQIKLLSRNNELLKMQKA